MPTLSSSIRQRKSFEKIVKSNKKCNIPKFWLEMNCKSSTPSSNDLLSASSVAVRKFSLRQHTSVPANWTV